MRRIAILLVLLSGCLHLPGDGPPRVSVPACDGPPFDVSPLALKDFTGILPLGHLNPPEHTTPADHVYFVLPVDPGGQTANVVNLSAPGRITITELVRTTSTQNGLSNRDYAIEFAICGGKTGRFGHVSDLVPEIEALGGGQWKNCNHFGDEPRGVDYEFCSIRVNHVVESGAKLGTAGGKSSRALDLWAHDSEAPPIVYANPKRYRDDHRTIACPLDFFAEPVRGSLRGRLGNGRGEWRTVEPVCGEVNQDGPGTAQGNWFVGNVEADAPESWRNSVALVHDNVNATLGAFSIGGPLESGLWTFAPRHDGTVNRDFDEVAPGQTYCYEAGTARFLVQLPDASHLRLERQAGACSGSVSFAAATTFER